MTKFLSKSKRERLEKMEYSEIGYELAKEVNNFWSSYVSKLNTRWAIYGFVMSVLMFLIGILIGVGSK